jgi:hypothetical protein
MNEPIEGTFSEAEMVKSSLDNNYQYKIEKIMKCKKFRGGKTMVLVKWMYYPSKFNTWISSDQVKDIK